MHQNSQFSERKSQKNFLGRGHSPSPAYFPGWEGNTPSPHPTPSASSAPRSSRLRRLDLPHLCSCKLTLKKPWIGRVQQAPSPSARGVWRSAVSSPAVFRRSPDRARFSYYFQHSGWPLLTLYNIAVIVDSRAAIVGQDLRATTERTQVSYGHDCCYLRNTDRASAFV